MASEPSETDEAADTAWIMRMLAIGPYECMRQDEIAAGHTPIALDAEPWLSSSDWMPDALVTWSPAGSGSVPLSC